MLPSSIFQEKWKGLWSAYCVLGDVLIPLDLCPLNKPALWYEHIGKLENTINRHVCWGDTHMHTCTETKTSPECMCFPIMYCRSVSWEASVGARGLCEEMGLWEQSSSGWEQCYTSAEWQTARPAGWAPSQREICLRNKTDGSWGATPEDSLYLHIHGQTHPHTERRSSSHPSREDTGRGL